MRKYENQPRPTAGCLSVPLFNQKRRNRLPLTSNPAENEFCSSNEYMPAQSSTFSNITSGMGYYQNHPPNLPVAAAQACQGNQQGIPQSHQQSQQYGNRRPAPGPAPANKAYACLPHPYKAEHINGNTQGMPGPPGGFSQTKSAYRPATRPEPHFSQQSKPTPLPSRDAPPVPQQPNSSWKCKATNNTGPKSQPVDDIGSRNPAIYKQTTPQTQTPAPVVVQPASDNTLRILTAVIDGMRHWSQFKDRAPSLFEIFATLDSAVTVGSHGAKNFLIRDGKQVVQCVFYENEQPLPRLIRGQVHRCVGNYDRTRDLLTCVSVRAALPSEQRNATDSVKVSDAEMRELVKPRNEV
ncbi:spermatogenesis-associated protein 22 [Aplochiton taeniatus]